MTKFLKKVAEHILNNDAVLSNSVVVLPNRRAIVYLKQYFSEMIDKPTWLPQMLSLEDFVVSHSDYKSADKLTLLAQLYFSYRQSNSSYTATFGEFLNWGNVLLNDFDEIDQYLADAVKLFKTLTDIKVIEELNLDYENVTPFQEQYIKFFSSFADCYTAYVSNLKSKNIGYWGMIIRNLVENLDDETFGKYDKIYFVGFNALTPAEEKLIKTLHEQNKAEVLFDADNYYMDDDNQESGYFLRQYYKNKPFGEFKWIENNFSEIEKNIEVYLVSSNTSQTKYAGHFLNDWIQKGLDENSTALVLPDENLLLPMLNSLPDSISKFNVTMGYPFANTSVYSFVLAIATVFYQAYSVVQHKSESDEKTKPEFLSKLVTDWLNNNLMNVLRNKDSDIEAIEIKDFKIGANYLQEIILKYFGNYDLSFNADSFAENSLEAIKYIIKLLELIYTQSEQQDNNLFSEKIIKSDTREYIAFAILKLNALVDILTENNLNIEYSSLLNIIDIHLRQASIPFEGEPLQGVQILGMLETRLLDFDNIIMLSLNEGSLPKNTLNDTFILYSLRKGFGLPDKSQKNSIFAYHFYRLLQRAKNVIMFYVETSAGEISAKEKSRFITQLFYELPYKNTKIKIAENFITDQVDYVEPTLRRQEKTKELMEILYSKFESGLSASSLNTYIECSLKFCYEYLLRLKSKSDSDVVQIGYSELGTIVHEALKTIYSPFVGKKINSNVLFSEINNVPKYITNAIDDKFVKVNHEQGINYLVKKIAVRYVEEFVRSQAIFTQKNDIYLISVEDGLTAKLNVELPNTDKTVEVNLFGIIDRIDKTDGEVRVIDYKTGPVKSSDISVKDFEEFTNSKKSKAFQLMFYALLVSENKIVEGNFTIGNISFVKYKSDYIKANILDDYDINAEKINNFKDVIGSVVLEMINPNVDFIATEDTKACRNCDYASICGRFQ